MRKNNIQQRYKQAHFILTGSYPSTDSTRRITSETEYKQALKVNLQGSGFEQFIKTGANDRLHTKEYFNTPIISQINTKYIRMS